MKKIERFIISFLSALLSMSLLSVPVFAQEDTDDSNHGVHAVQTLYATVS